MVLDAGPHLLEEPTQRIEVHFGANVLQAGMLHHHHHARAADRSMLGLGPLGPTDDGGVVLTAERPASTANRPSSEPIDRDDRWAHAEGRKVSNVGGVTLHFSFERPVGR